MSAPRIASFFAVGVLIRLIEAEGGFAVVAARGDSNAGAIVILCLQRGEIAAILERSLRSGETYTWHQTGQELIDNKPLLDDYLTRRRRHDPDLWLIEADVPDVERFIAQLASSG